MEETMIETIENKEVKAQMYNVRAWIKGTDAVELQKTFDALLKLAGYKVLNFTDHDFPNGGYTCLWLLAESHLAIHTFVADNKSYIELSGCNRSMNIKFREAFDEQFSGEIIEKLD